MPAAGAVAARTRRRSIRERISPGVGSAEPATGATVIELGRTGEAPRAPTESEIESAVLRIGSRIGAAYPSRLSHPVRAVDEHAMLLATRQPEVQAALFRFVDAAPACQTSRELVSHLQAYLGQVSALPRALRALGVVGRGRLGNGIVAGFGSLAVRRLGQRFIVGGTTDSAISSLRDLWESGIAVSLDLLGEATLTPHEADDYAQACAASIDLLNVASTTWAGSRILERDRFGALPRANISLKVSALTPMMRSTAPARGCQDAAIRLRPLLRCARDSGAHLHLDMESFDTLETTFQLVFELLHEPEFIEGPSIGVVLQAYLRNSAELLDRLLSWVAAEPRGHPLTIRLVKGAYWDHEVAQARQRGWDPPVYTEKAATDRNFETLTRRLIDARAHVRVAIGSHNLRSIAHALAYNHLTGGDPREVEFQVLHGLGDDLREALVREGLSVRVYCPVGDLVEGMAYLVRRLLENTSSTSFLRAHGRGVLVAPLLQAP